MLETSQLSAALTPSSICCSLLHKPKLGDVAWLSLQVGTEFGTTSLPIAPVRYLCRKIYLNTEGQGTIITAGTGNNQNVTFLSRTWPKPDVQRTSNRIAFCLCPLVSSKNNCGHVSTCEPLPCAISRLDRTLRGWHQLCKKKETPILCASRNLNQANWYLCFICSIKKPRNTKHFLLNTEMTFSFQVSAKIQVYPKNK